MARRSSQQSVSLFPFLAVLVCTMGALILLLLVTTRRMRQEQAKYTAAVEVIDDLESGSLPEDTNLEAADFVVASKDDEDVTPAEQIPFQNQWLPTVNQHAEELKKLNAEIAAANVRKEDLLEQSDQLAASLVEQQDQLKTVKTLIQDAELELLTAGSDSRQLDQVQDQLKDLTDEKTDLELQIDQQKKLLAGVQAELEEKSAFTEEAEAVLRKRESALVSLRRLVAKSSENLATGSSATRLEFTNTNGTSKVPIVVNVDEKGFTLQPSGITVTLDDLKGFPANDNPLLAGIQAAAAHRSKGLLADDAYVLLLVRPTGSLGFYQAQQVMTNAHIHFGYELLEADRTVDLGQPNDEETKIVRQSVLEALSRRANLYGSLLAAQRRGGMAGAAELDRQRREALSGPSSGRTPDPDERTGPDGRTLEQVLDFGRVYAGGEAKPEPEMPRMAGNDARYGNRQWPSSPRQPQQSPQTGNLDGVQQQAVAANPPPIQMFPATEQPVDRQPSSGLGEWPKSRVGNQLAESDGANPGQAIAGMDFRQDRTQKLSENLGLNSHQTSGKQPNAFGVEANGENQIADRESESDPGSSEVDWPFVEAAPQQEGTRPVDPNLLSEFMGIQSPAESSQTAQKSPEQHSTVQISPRVPRELSRGFSGQPTDSTVRPRPSFEASRLGDASPPPSKNAQQATQPDSQAIPLLADSSSSGVGGRPGSPPYGNQSGQGPPKPVDPKQSYLQQFLDEVEQQRSKTMPNPVLLRLLRRANGTQDGQLSGNMPSSEITKPTPQLPAETTQKAVSQSTLPPSKAAASHPAPKTAAAPVPPKQPEQQPVAKPSQKPQPVYYVVRIYVSDDELIVGPFEGIDIKGWSDQQVADAAFQGVSETMKEVWADVRKDALPAVRFLSAKGAQERCQVTSKNLQSRDIPTRALQLEDVDFSLDRFFSDDLPPTTRSPQPTNSAGASGATQQAVQPSGHGRRSI